MKRVARLLTILLAMAPSIMSLVDLETADAQEAVNLPKSTVGLDPPQGAVVLFDGSNFDAWKSFSWQWINPKDNQKQIQWKLVDNKAMQIAFEFNGKRRKQFLCTKAKFGDYRLHLEFQLPEDGGKGNSGIFFGPLYELQILDSSKKEKEGRVLIAPE